MADILTLGELKVLFRDCGMPDDTPVYISTNTLGEDVYAAAGLDTKAVVEDAQFRDVLAIRGELIYEELIDPTDDEGLDLGSEIALHTLSPET